MWYLSVVIVPLHLSEDIPEIYQWNKGIFLFHIVGFLNPQAKYQKFLINCLSFSFIKYHIVGLRRTSEYF